MQGWKYGKGLIYLRSIFRLKKQHIGETKRTLPESLKGHRQATNNPLHANATTAVPSNFNQTGHSIIDIALILFYLICNLHLVCHAVKQEKLTS